ncbi:MAG TPA: hypothetical protein ENF32_03295 [Thermosulfidibacter takaii]|uniref:Holin of 3TMs, for gene-transfer release n=1 Tax=Thermosulfidibacter takaii TaxID=412593 RepID=A0A7C0YB18_9BACT|nr:hypothetical protein [Thermosulfidibacter takaii]
MGPLLLEIAPVVGGLVKEVLKRVLPPEKMSEEERKKLEMEAAAQATQLFLERYSKEMEDVMNARSLAMVEAQNAPWLVRLLRGLVRPIIGFGCATIWGYNVLAPQFLNQPRIPLNQWDYFVIMSVLSFYFGLRTFEKTKGSQARF